MSGTSSDRLRSGIRDPVAVDYEDLAKKHPELLLDGVPSELHSNAFSDMRELQSELACAEGQLRRTEIELMAEKEKNAKLESGDTVTPAQYMNHYNKEYIVEEELESELKDVEEQLWCTQNDLTAEKEKNAKLEIQLAENEVVIKASEQKISDLARAQIDVHNVLETMTEKFHAEASKNEILTGKIEELKKLLAEKEAEPQLPKKSTRTFKGMWGPKPAKTQAKSEAESENETPAKAETKAQSQAETKAQPQTQPTAQAYGRAMKAEAFNRRVQVWRDYYSQAFGQAQPPLLAQTQIPLQAQPQAPLQAQPQAPLQAQPQAPLQAQPEVQSEAQPQVQAYGRDKNAEVINRRLQTWRDYYSQAPGQAQFQAQPQAQPEDLKSKLEVAEKQIKSLKTELKFETDMRRKYAEWNSVLRSMSNYAEYNKSALSEYIERRSIDEFVNWLEQTRETALENEIAWNREKKKITEEKEAFKSTISTLKSTLYETTDALKKEQIVSNSRLYQLHCINNGSELHMEPVKPKETPELKEIPEPETRTLGAELREKLEALSEQIKENKRLAMETLEVMRID